MATLSVIRRWALREQMSIREIARRTGLSRNTVKKYLRAGEEMPRYAKRESSSKLDPYAEKLATWLAIEATKSRKQRRNLRQIHTHYAPRGINGPMDDLLFPIHHGILYYPGFEVLPPYVVHRTGKVDAAAYARIEQELGARMDTLFSTAPIPFRRQNHGDYEIPALTLRPDIAPGRSGFGVHQAPAEAQAAAEA